jgi:VWFA-related protein
MLRKIVAGFLSLTLVGFGQQPAAPAAAAPEGAYKITVNTQMVIETVTVKDKNGKAVEGLTAKDFIVTEDGVPQTIVFTEHQQFEDTPEPPLPVDTKAVAARPKFNHSQITTEKPGNIHYKDKRLLCLYFDTSNMPIPDQLRAFAAAEKFIRTQMTRSDLVSIVMYAGGAVQILEDFTDDRDKLLSTIGTLVVGEDENAIDNVDAAAADKGAAFGQDDSEFNIFSTDRQLSALQTVATMLSQLNEMKSLIYFASGVRMQGQNNQAQLHSTINAAVRAGVRFYPVDARGLIAMAPMGDATRASPGGQAMYTGAGAMAMTTGLQRSQDTLFTLGADTGGKALLDFNDLTMGIVQAQKAFSSYYILGYYTSNQNLDGKFRRIKISLREGLAASLDYRQGYFSGKQFGKFNSVEKDRQLEEALMLGDPVTELTIALDLGYFQLNNAEYFVPVTVKIPGSELVLARKGGAEHTLIDFIGEIKDEYGTTMASLRDRVDAKLTGQTAAELAKKPLVDSTGFTVLPGKYRIKFLARDAETGRMGTYERPFVIPNLNKEDKRVPISSVVLSSQRQDMRDAIFNATKDKQKSQNQTAADPLIQDGMKLIPSVTNVFSAAKDMYVYLQAYEQNAETWRPLVAFVTFYQGQNKVFETAPLAVTEGLNNRLKTVPLQFSFALAKLPPGEYNCQVTVLDPEGQKAAFWSSSVMLIP